MNEIAVLVCQDPDGGIKVMGAFPKDVSDERIINEIKKDFDTWCDSPISQAEDRGVDLFYTFSRRDEDGYVVTLGYGEDSEYAEEGDSWYMVHYTTISA